MGGNVICTAILLIGYTIVITSSVPLERAADVEVIPTNAVKSPELDYLSRTFPLLLLLKIVFQIRGQAGNRCLTVHPTERSTVTIEDCRGTIASLWLAVRDASVKGLNHGASLLQFWVAKEHSYILINMQTLSGISAGVDTELFLTSGAKFRGDSHWKIANFKIGYGPIVSSVSGRCVDVEGESTQSGTKVIQWRCNGQDNQAWMIQKTLIPK